MADNVASLERKNILGSGDLAWGRIVFYVSMSGVKGDIFLDM